MHDVCCCNSGLDDEPAEHPPKRGRRSPEVTLDPPVAASIEAPHVGDVGGRAVKVLLCRPCQPVWVELTESNVAYLVDAVAHQVACGCIKRKHPREEVPLEERASTTGVSRAYARGAWRVGSKYFKEEASALAFVDSKDRRQKGHR